MTPAFAQLPHAATYDRPVAWLPAPSYCLATCDWPEKERRDSGRDKPRGAPSARITDTVGSLNEDVYKTVNLDNFLRNQRKTVIREAQMLF